MKKVVNSIIPFKGFISMAMWPLVFIRKELEGKFNFMVERHENTHGEQQKEMLLIGVALTIVLLVIGCSWWSLFALPLFLWWYGLEYLFRLVQYMDLNLAYRNISFEREAYVNERNPQYLDSRRHFAWFNYLKYQTI